MTLVEVGPAVRRASPAPVLVPFRAKSRSGSDDSRSGRPGQRQSPSSGDQADDRGRAPLEGGQGTSCAARTADPESTPQDRRPPGRVGRRRIHRSNTPRIRPWGVRRFRPIDAARLRAGRRHGRFRLVPVRLGRPMPPQPERRPRPRPGQARPGASGSGARPAGRPGGGGAGGRSSGSAGSGQRPDRDDRPGRSDRSSGGSRRDDGRPARPAGPSRTGRGSSRVQWSSARRSR